MLNFRSNLDWLAVKREGEEMSETPSDTRGKQGELGVIEAVRNLGGEDWDVFHRRRVPRLDSHRGKGEIDVIAVGERAVLAVEAKTWRGEVSIEGDDFLVKSARQRRSRRPRRTRGKVAKTNAEKVRSLEWAFRAAYKSAIDFPVFSVVIFSDRRCRLSDEVSRRDDCWHIDELDEMYEKLVTGEQQMNQDARAEIIRMISQLGTWDDIRYTGGRTLEGDIADESGVVSLNGVEIVREGGISVEIEPSRGRIATILLGPSIKARVGDGAGTTSTIRLDPFCKLNVVLPPLRKRAIPIQQVQGFSYGHEGIEHWRLERNTRREEIEVGKVDRSKEKEIFEKDKRVSGTALNWTDGGLWVSLDLGGVDGILPNDQFQLLEISKQIFVKGTEIPVIMNNISSSGIIYLRYDDIPD